MRLEPIDELPFHQHPAPFNLPATTDAKFNDGYWFAFYTPGWYFVTGLRLHPNVNAMDGFAALTHDDRQHCVRASRALRPGYGDLVVGPLRLEIVEPLQRLRLVLDENPIGLCFDVVFESQAPPFVEERYQHFKYGAVINDLLRYTQVCRVRGTVAFGDDELDVDGWHGMRDHSWGVRSSMGPSVRVGGVERGDTEADRRAFRLWVPFEVDDHCGFFNTHENRAGEPLDFEGRLDYKDGRSVKLRSVRHALEYEHGTRRPVGGWFELLGEDGLTRRYDMRKAGSPADVQGLGYYGGWHDGGSAGLYRGATHVEHDVYETRAGLGLTGPPHVPPERRLGPTEYPSLLTGPGGAEGMAHFEHHVFGPYDPYGLS